MTHGSASDRTAPTARSATADTGRVEMLLASATLASLLVLAPLVISNSAANTSSSLLLVGLAAAFGLMCAGTAFLAGRLFRDFRKSEAPKVKRALQFELFRERSSSTPARGRESE